MQRGLQIYVGYPASPQEVGSIQHRRGQKSLMLHLEPTFALRYRLRIHTLLCRTHHETYSYQPKKQHAKELRTKPNSAHPPLTYHHSKTRVTHPRLGRSVRTVTIHASPTPRLEADRTKVRLVPPNTRVAGIRGRVEQRKMLDAS